MTDESLLQETLGRMRSGSIKETLEELTEKNDKEIISADIMNGNDVVRRRAIIYDAAYIAAFGKIIDKFKPKTPFAIVALGGQGRRERCPLSDNDDIGIIVDDAFLTGNTLIEGFREEGYYSFEKETGFFCQPRHYTLDGLPNLVGKELNSFLDMRPLIETNEFTERAKQHIVDNCPRIPLFLHNVALWESLEKRKKECGESLESWNIKEDVLRYLQIGYLFSEATLSWKSSREVLDYSNPELRNNLGILLKTRSWLHLHKQINGGIKSKKEIDVLKIDDLHAFQRQFGADALGKMLKARNYVRRFAESKLSEKIRDGIQIDEPEREGRCLFTYGSNGLRYSGNSLNSAEERNNALYSLFEFSQRHGIKIDHADLEKKFENLPLWITRNPGFGRLFYAPGSVYNSLMELNEISALPILIPGMDTLNTTLNVREHKQPNLTMGAYAREKVKILEEMVLTEQFKHIWDSLSPDKRAAINFAFQIKHIPRIDENLPGTSPQYAIKEYIDIVGKGLGFTDETLDTSKWILENRELFREFCIKRLNDVVTVRAFTEKVGTEERMNTLWLFMHADDGRKANDSERHIWNNARELRAKTILEFNNIPETNPTAFQGFEREHREILKDLGPDFETSRYKGLAPQLVPTLSKVYGTKEPVIKPTGTENSQRTTLTIFCPDYSGLIAGIAGNLYERRYNLKQLHAFTLTKHKLALDFLDVELPIRSRNVEGLIESLKETISQRTMSNISPEEILNSLRNKRHELKEGEEYHRLSFYTPDDCPGIIYALTRTLYDKTNAQANICGINAVVDKGKVENHLFFTLRPDSKGQKMEFGELQRRLNPYFE